MKALNDKQRRKMVQISGAKADKWLLISPSPNREFMRFLTNLVGMETGKEGAAPSEPPKQTSKTKTTLQKGKNQMHDSSDNFSNTGSHDPIELVVYDEHDDDSFAESGSFDLMEALDTAFGVQRKEKTCPLEK